MPRRLTIDQIREMTDEQVTEELNRVAREINPYAPVVATPSALTAEDIELGAQRMREDHGRPDNPYLTTAQVRESYGIARSSDQVIRVQQAPMPSASSFRWTSNNNISMSTWKPAAKPIPHVPADHPIHFLVELATDLGITAFQFAAYQYDTSRGDEYPARARNETTKIIKSDDLIKNYVDYVNSPESGYGEIAIQSAVWIDKEKYHMPLIDFSSESVIVIEEALDHSSPVLGMDRNDFKIYHSGASYHAYGKLLLSEQEAIPEYSSRLLLVNHPKATGNIVDPRWVGHSQLKGMFSLRLTNNGKPQLPKLIK